jgi:ferredoxin
VLDVDGLQALIERLASDGWTVFGPVVRDGAITTGPVTTIDDLPRGVTDDQQPGRYRLHEDGAGFFGYAAAATSWKSLLFPARRALWRTDGAGHPVAAELDRTRRALLGVRSCDLHAMALQDAVLAGRSFTDPDYVARRQNTFIIAVTCGTPADTCFCTSMGKGPAPVSGFDVALTELLDAGGHRFLVESGSDAGAALLDQLPTRPVTAADEDTATRVVDEAVARIHRRVDTEGLRDVLFANAEHPRWDDIASRCLGCTNCTLVCPTCFCITTEDVSDLTEPVGRDRVWDSCFNAEHSYLHGGPVRRSTRTRYRQWLTHKFASWIDQFGTSGCVGCGRCITWCPAGIDITEELAAIRATTDPEDKP